MSRLSCERYQLQDPEQVPLPDLHLGAGKFYQARTQRGQRARLPVPRDPLFPRAACGQSRRRRRGAVRATAATAVRS